jgi:hypothetical protein
MPWWRRRPRGRELRIGKLGERHEERAAAAALRLDLLVERVEQRQDALAGRADAGRGGLGQPLPVETVGALDVRGDQVVLGGEQPVERGGATSASAAMASTPVARMPCQ